MRSGRSWKSWGMSPTPATISPAGERVTYHWGTPGPWARLAWMLARYSASGTPQWAENHRAARSSRSGRAARETITPDIRW